MIVRLSRRAQSNIKQIYRYTVENFGETQAELYLGGLDYTFDLLTDNPMMGKAYSGDVRYYLYKMHRVFYTLQDDDIIILQVRNARQSPPEE